MCKFAHRPAEYLNSTIFHPVNFPYFLRLFSIFFLWGVATNVISEARMNPSKLNEISEEINAWIEDGNIPGAVLWIESRGEVFHSAYGHRMTFPELEPMTVDTIFDVASLTKVLATAPSILHLLDQGKLSLHDPVEKFIPLFKHGGIHEKAKDKTLRKELRSDITILHLLTHQSGLPPAISLQTKEFWGHDEGIARAATIGLLERPGTRFRYSDVNYILLGEIVWRVSGQKIDLYTKENFYYPLGMDRTGYVPTREWIPEIAPTTFIRSYGIIRGEVHDPTARRMRGVAGHAGLFSTAGDIAKFCRLFLKGGTLGDTRIFSEKAVKLATRPHTPQELEAPRGLGWDIGSSFSYHRGEKFPLEGFGHTGWTGTSIWVDPASETFVILLANRNHPSESGSIKKLRIKIATLAAEAVGYTKIVPDPSSTPTSAENESGDCFAQTAAGDPKDVLNGIDVLEADGFKKLAGMKVGLITNHTGINRDRRSTIDLLANAPNVNLVRLFSPEHGIRGTLETDTVDDGKDDRTGLPVISLYQSKDRKPSAEELGGLDALVFDIQDIGCRFYTYISTMGLAMEAANEHGKKFVVLDRVNPIGGEVFDGPIRTGQGNDFVAFHDVPVIHGMTAGELAKMFKAERGLDKLSLEVIPLRGWKRSMRFDETKLPWINPSPNIRSLTEALLYPGIGLLEFSNLSVGRGTTTPFEVVGAPWITEGRLMDRLAGEELPGIRFLPIRFTPKSSVYRGEDCGGVRMTITDRSKLNSIDVGLAIGRAILRDYPNTFNLKEKGNILLRHPDTHSKWIKGSSTKSMRRSWDKSLKRFGKRRQNFLIYSE